MMTNVLQKNGVAMRTLMSRDYSRNRLNACILFFCLCMAFFHSVHAGANQESVDDIIAKKMIPLNQFNTRLSHHVFSSMVNGLCAVTPDTRISILKRASLVQAANKYEEFPSYQLYTLGYRSCFALNSIPSIIEKELWAVVKQEKDSFSKWFNLEGMPKVDLGIFAMQHRGQIPKSDTSFTSMCNNYANSAKVDSAKLSQLMDADLDFREHECTNSMDTLSHDSTINEEYSAIWRLMKKRENATTDDADAISEMIGVRAKALEKIIESFDQPNSEDLFD